MLNKTDEYGPHWVIASNFSELQKSLEALKAMKEKNVNSKTGNPNFLKATLKFEY